MPRQLIISSGETDYLGGKKRPQMPSLEAQLGNRSGDPEKVTRRPGLISLKGNLAAAADQTAKSGRKTNGISQKCGLGPVSQISSISPKNARPGGPPERESRGANKKNLPL